ncbi:MAG: L-serine ammonia-lyase, iron-sulfur-dependent, subunit alpha [Firmicutes bacterium]|nr:L-serine ammonia-lyase, iron-sulfur-dependent, subunit alpha [Bacillota bacterium]
MSQRRKEGVRSLRQLYRIGYGPSSSHTIGVGRAAEAFRNAHPSARRFEVTLYASLALTGVGHGTDAVIKKVFAGHAPVEIIFDEDTITDINHPNTMDMRAYLSHERVCRARFISTGGGAITMESCDCHVEISSDGATVRYPHSKFTDIRRYCAAKKIRLCDYVYETEGESIREFLAQIWEQMKKTISAGITVDGVLPGGLNLQREAKGLFTGVATEKNPEALRKRIVAAYAYATAEENAGGGLMVTAPTCGACGVLPAVLLYLQQKNGFSDQKIIDALATAGLIGTLIKTNASISGAECGCQAEIGSACSMAAAAVGELFDMSLSRIEYAAEIAMEHHLGLTCDPVRGLVQIPCIERNAVAAMRALDAASLADMLSDTRPISFDMVVETMYQTGLDMHADYRETALGGLAKVFRS